MNKDYFVFLEIAFEDLNASRELFKLNFYPQSIFYLQQSIEKIIKYVGLKNKTIDEKDLRKSISHKTSKIFKKEIVKQTEGLNQVDIENLNKVFQGLEQVVLTESDENIIPIIMNIMDNFSSSTEEEIDLPEINSVEKLITFLEEKNVDPEVTLNLKKTASNPDIHKFLTEQLLKFLPNLVQYVKSIQILFVMNIYFENLVSKMRYPINESLTNPSLIYTHEHLLVKSLNYFHENTYQCLKQIQKTYN